MDAATQTEPSEREYMRMRSKINLKIIKFFKIKL